MKPTHPTRILIAEDVSSVAQLMRTVLANEGYEVQTVDDGEACMRTIASFQPRVVILDVMLPGLHGMEILRRIKENPATRETGVIVCTAKPYKADQDQALELGAFAVLSKPFPPPRLVEMVNNFVAGVGAADRAETATAAAPAYLPEIEPGRRYFKLWGTRGSIPVSNPRCLRHGGNTSCVEIGLGDEFVIVDAGTGIRELGLKLLQRGPGKIHLLITHTHWDHIQGFPFFAPAYVPGFEINVYGAATFKKDLGSVFQGQLDRDYFPVQFDDMNARIQFKTLAKPLKIGSFEIDWEYTHHPAATVAYKFQNDGRSLAYVSDNEFLFGYMGSPEEIRPKDDAVASYQPLIDLIDGCDLLIAEAQYTNEEYPKKIGWGHSSISNACALARLAKAREWIVTHHDPAHDDEFLDKMLNLTRHIMEHLRHPIPINNAYDGMHRYW